MINRELLKKNRIYEAVYQQMLGYEKAYLGGLIFKQHTRRKRPSEDSTLYLDLIANTVAQPICRYIVDTINDVLFEPGVKRDLKFCTPEGAYISPETNDWVDQFVFDADLTNRSLNSFMEEVGDLSSIFGHCWVAVDMPPAEQGNQGRPYAVSLSPLNVWDWEFEYYGGKPILKHVKVMEFENDQCFYIKCYHLGDSTTPSRWCQYELDKNQVGNNLDNAANLISEGYFPPGMGIPLFIAYGRKDPRIIDIGVSDIDSAADAMREYYKLECEAYSSLQFAKTLIRANKGVSIPVHAGAIVRAQAGDIEAIKIDTADVNVIMEKQNDILQHLESLVGLGGLRNTKATPASGVALIQERKQLHRSAKSKARLMEVTEELIFTYAARFMGMRWAGEVNYITDYESHDTNFRLALLSQAKQLTQDNPLVDVLINRELVRLLAPDDEVSEYEEVFANSIKDPAIRKLLIDENREVGTRDIGSQIPGDESALSALTGDETGNKTSEGVNNYTENNGQVKLTNATMLGGAGTPVQATGTSYYPSQAVAVQLTGLNTGR